MLEKQLTKVVSAAAANLNQAQNTVLLTLDVTKPIEIRRLAVVSQAAEGLLAAMDLKLRKAPAATGTAADVAGSVLTGAVKARGEGIYKDMESRITAEPGDRVTLCVETAAGGASTGLVWIEYAELPFVGAEIDNMAESA